MEKKKNKVVWIEAKRRCQLNEADLQMVKDSSFYVDKHWKITTILNRDKVKINLEVKK